ncbi:uncharacterized protein STAUR_2992 [Stigmatella aurantiaca DW4/3-1]|uniref:Secreted protein n=1 Tax=Stigmatella aurantiaca (strain DW4/3-1) TaxID=378806 RepID=E3FS61_STIAD|nr:uncharacterized protein STAUR_2992 [Stigmatella aurantiaca DW4/3-1]
MSGTWSPALRAALSWRSLFSAASAAPGGLTHKAPVSAPARATWVRSWIDMALVERRRGTDSRAARFQTASVFPHVLGKLHWRGGMGDALHGVFFSVWALRRDSVTATRV